MTRRRIAAPALPTAPLLAGLIAAPQAAVQEKPAPQPFQQGIGAGGIAPQKVAGPQPPGPQ